MEASPPVETLVLEPPRRLSLPSLREIWGHRDLVYLLARRDIAIRYKQTAVGALWAVMQPLLLAAVFTVFFGILADVPSKSGVRYPVFALSGMVLWLCFVNAMTRSSVSTVLNAELVSKVYFPRAILPLAAVIAPAVDFLVGFVVLIAVMLGYGYIPGAQVLLVPLVLALALIVALGVGLWLSAFHVKYHDVNLLLPFLVLVGLAMTPVVYPFDLIPESVQPLYACNPMVGILEAYRWMLFPESDWPGAIVAVPIVIGFGLLVSGALFFKRSEPGFADII